MFIELYLLQFPPFLCFASHCKFSSVLLTPPSIFIPVLKLNTLLDQTEDGWWQVKGDYWFNFSQLQTSCFLWSSFATCVHCVFSLCLLSFLFHLTFFNLIFVAIAYLWFFFFINSFFSVIFCFLLPSNSFTIDQIAVVGHCRTRAIS